MKIAFFSDNFYPEISGIADATMLLGKELIARGHEIMYVGPHYPKKAFDRANLPHEELTHGRLSLVKRIPSLPLPGSPTDHARIALPFGFSLPAIRRFKPDIIHVQSPFGCGFEALYASKLFGIPLVGTNHTPISEFIKYSPVHIPFLGYIAEKFYVWFYNRCSFVSGPSDIILSDMVKMGLHRPHQTISNPIDVSHFVPVTEERKQELKKKYSVGFPTILYTGRLAEEKRINIIIEAISRLAATIPEIRLIITGYGNAEKKLKALAHERGVADKIIFTGFVSTETLVELYQASDIFTIMSTAETQCLSMMQAMATRLPSIVARALALPEYVGHDRGIVVDIDDVSGLTEAVATLVKDPAQRQHMGARAYDFVHTLASPLIAERWEEVYKKCILT